MFSAGSRSRRSRSGTKEISATVKDAAHSESIRANSATGETSSIETPFEWKTLKEKKDDDDYQDTVHGLCMESPD